MTHTFAAEAATNAAHADVIVSARLRLYLACLALVSRINAMAHRVARAALGAGLAAAKPAHIADVLSRTAFANGRAQPAATADADIAGTIIPPHNGAAPRDAVATLDDAGLPTIDAPALLAAVDYAALNCPGADEEALEFFLAEAVGRLWAERSY